MPVTWVSQTAGRTQVYEIVPPWFQAACAAVFVEFTRMPPPVRFTCPPAWMLSAFATLPRSSAMIANWLLSGSAPATPRTRTVLSVDCAGTSAVRTSAWIRTSRYSRLPANGPEEGGRVIVTVAPSMPFVKPFRVASAAAAASAAVSASASAAGRPWVLCW